MRALVCQVTAEMTEAASAAADHIAMTTTATKTTGTKKTGS
ncbi:hypothetical protein [Dongia sp.]